VVQPQGAIMLNAIIGSVLLLATIVLYVWVLPKEGQPSRLPNKWGLTILLPIAIAGFGISGLMLLAKSIIS
jgi:hypothetical protein